MSGTLGLRVRALTIVVGVCAVLGLLAVAGAPSASAALQHPYLSQLTGTPGGSFSGDVCGVAVDPATQDVYVADSGSDAIDVFSSAGVYQSQITGASVPTGPFSGPYACSVAVSDTTGDVYVADSGPEVVYVFDALGGYLATITGTPSEHFHGYVHVAVDRSSGAVYIAETSQGIVDRFSSANEYQSQITGLAGAWGLASDSSGDVYVSERGAGGVFEFNSSGVEVRHIAGAGVPGGFENVTGVAVDSAGNVEVSDNGTGAIDEFNSAGVFLDQTKSAGSDLLGAPEGLAVNAAGDLYVADRRSPGIVDVFGPSVVLADVSTEGASGVTNTTATIAGSVNPDGTATTYQFQYGTSTAYGSTSPATPGSVGSDSSPHALSANLSGLAPATVYHYRIVASNPNGTNYGLDETFRTAGPPTVDAETVANITQLGGKIEAEVNPGGFDTHVHVEYGTDTGYGSSTPPVDIGPENTDQSTSNELAGLRVGTSYHYRVIATNSQGSVNGPDETFTTLPAAQIEEESVSEVGSTEATLNAQINDLGLLSTYQFEYGTTTAYGSTTPTESLGATSESQDAVLRLNGLTTGTVYHYRIAVRNEAGSAQGADATFTTARPTVSGLPDGRGYEMVSPAQDYDANMYRPGGGLQGQYVFESGVGSILPFQAAADGSSVAYAGDPTSGGNGGGVIGGNEYLARRLSSGGWAQTNTQPAGRGTPLYLGFSSDLSVGLFQAAYEASYPPLALEVPPGYTLFYTRDELGGFHATVTVMPPHRENSDLAESFAGMSTDSRHTLLEINDALTPNAVDGGPNANNLYDSFGGRLYLVNVLPDGHSAPAATFGTVNFPENINQNLDQRRDLSNVVSGDGSRIFWTDLNTGNLYVRENDTTGDARTVQVDAPQGLGSGGGGRFWTASGDGSRVFFTDSASAGLTSDTMPGSGENLYEFDVSSGQLRDLTPAGKVSVEGVIGASKNGEYVYFTAEGVLAVGAIARHANLYESHAGAITLVAVLAKSDENILPTYYQGTSGGVHGDWQPDVGVRTAQVAPNGLGVVFMSTLSLTGYENRGLPEVYVYEAEERLVHCVSCSPTGEPPTLTSSATEEQPGGFLSVSENATYAPRWISGDGGQVFFDSVEPLVSQDVNGRLDVYEWERDGSGSCRDASGCIYALSGGTSTAGSWLIDASASGGDVFFTTRGKLVPGDQNENIDVYDARVGAAQPLVSPVCTGTGCQGVPLAPPVFATPSSETFAGVGNYPPTTSTRIKPRAKAEGRTRQLKHALWVCRKQPAHRRVSCRRRAVRRFGARSKASRLAVNRGGN